MKNICVLLSIACIYAAVDAYSIVFVHLGPTLPAYLVDAVCQARLFSKNADIIVIAEQKAIKQVDPAPFSECSVTFVACEQLAATPMHKKFNKETKVNKQSRQGFWWKSTERLFYVDELIKQFELTDVFHLEYDNMLYVDLETLLPAFHAYSNIAVTFNNDDVCVAGCMYIAHSQSLHTLMSYIANMAHRGLTDMKIIAQFKKQNNETQIDHLPTIMPEYIELFGLRSKKGHRTAKPERYICNFDGFNSVFDGAALGQFLGGYAPCHGKPKPGVVNESCLFNPSKLSFTWEVDQEGRRVPFASCGQRRYRINNLHIHSKNLKAFAS